MVTHTRQTQVNRIPKRRTMQKRKVYSQDDLSNAVSARESGISWDTIRKLFTAIYKARSAAALRISSLVRQIKNGPTPVDS